MKLHPPSLALLSVTLNRLEAAGFAVALSDDGKVVTVAASRKKLEGAVDDGAVPRAVLDWISE